MKCNECEILFKGNRVVKIIKLLKTKNLTFCSQECYEAFNTRILDEIKLHIGFAQKEELDKAYQEGFGDAVNNLEGMAKKEYDKGYDEGLITGIKEGIKYKLICPVCKKNAVESVHHIIPREFKGYTEPDNVIPLCNKCHDEAEISTKELFERGHFFDSKTLRSFILNGFPKSLLRE